MHRAEPPPSLRAEQPTALAVVLSRALWLLDRTRSFRRDMDFVQLVEIDPVLRGAVLRITQSPVYAASIRELSLPAALERLGPEILTESLRAAAPRAEDATPHAVRSRCTRWLRGIAWAAAARWLANQGEYEDPDEAYVAGLAFALCDGGDLRGSARAPVSVDGLARLRLSPRAAVVARSATPQTEDERTAGLRRLVQRGRELAESLGFRPEADETTAAIEMLDGSGAPPEDPDTGAVAEAISLELAHAAGLVGLPAMGPSEFAVELMKAERAALAEGLHLPAARRDRAPALVRMADAHKAVLALRTEAAIPDILDRALQMLHRELDFDRVLVVEREHGNPYVARIRTVACRTHFPGPGPRALVEVPIGPGGAIERALDGGAAYRSTPDHDLGTLRMLGVPAFVAAPLVAGSGAFGAILGDHVLTARDVTPEEVAALSVAAGALGMVLENVALQTEGKTLRGLAEKDALTGINNRRNVLEILRREIDRARRYGKPLSVCLVDVDHFKTWNDMHGHQVGDVVLQSVAQLISSVSREIDACGRYGGEEFLVILPETGAEHAMLYAERLRIAVEAHGTDLKSLYPDTALSVSIGVTQLLPRGDDADQMIQRADTALYAAKAHGRNRVCVEWARKSAKPLAPPVAKGILDEV